MLHINDSQQTQKLQTSVGDAGNTFRTAECVVSGKVYAQLCHLNIVLLYKKYRLRLLKSLGKLQVSLL